MPKYVIIGGSAGGIGAVEAIREVDPVGSIVVVSDEFFPQYSRPMIAEYLSGGATLETLKYRDDQLWQHNKVQALLGRTAIHLDLIHNYVELDGEDKIHFNKLLLATGGKPFVPEVVGSDKDGVFTFTTLSDAEQLAVRINEGIHAVVIGGGLIGVSIADALVKRGVKVTVVELKDRVLNLLLDATASNIVTGLMKRVGVHVVTGQTVKEIVGKPDDEGVVGGVVLTNGETLPCDLVIMAIGVVPRKELVTGTEVETNRGILVDQFMQTTVPDVFSCGDVAEAYDFILEERRPLPLWPLAYLGGRVAGYNMAGKKTAYPGGTAMSALKHFDIPIISIGLANLDEQDDYEELVTHDPLRKLYKKIVLKDNLIVGMTFVGDIERAGIIFYLMKNRIPVGGFKESLISDDFGLITLPETVRTRLLLNLFLGI